MARPFKVGDWVTDTDIKSDNKRILYKIESLRYGTFIRYVQCKKYDLAYNGEILCVSVLRLRRVMRRLKKYEMTEDNIAFMVTCELTEL